jgi:hypothetical protein
MFSRKICFLALFLIPSSASAASIDWEIANRYRLFKDEAQFRTIAQTYAELPDGDRRDRPAYALEIALENKAAARKLGKAFGDPASVARYGWTSAIVGADKNCFSAGDKSYFNCKLANGDGYLEPKTFDALAKLTGASLPGQTCQWSVNGKPAGQAGCDKAIRLPDIPFGMEFSIAVAAGGAPVASIERQTGRVATIVGMGDSFAAGEGNPDKPVLFGTGKFRFRNSSHIDESGWHWPGEPDSAFRLYPLREGVRYGSFGEPANFGASYAASKWLMEQCHRSLYSQQVKSSLALALEQKHVAVTFLGYACTGATVDQGMLGYWEGRGDRKYTPAQFYDASPQVMKLLRDLCRSPKGYNIYREPDDFDWARDIRACADRRLDKIDAVLLSIGGNDVKFANVIVNESLATGGDFDPFRKRLFAVWRELADPVDLPTSLNFARTELPHHYRDLSDAFQKLVPVDGRKVILTAYPQMTELADGKVCDSRRAIEGMQVHEILGLRSPNTGRVAADFVRQLTAAIQKAVDDLPEAQRWQVVSDHVEAFAGHAICPGDVSTGVWNFPTWSGAHPSQGHWLNFPPRNWVAYAPRDRWFMTPNDAFLTGDYMRPGVPPPDGVQPLFAATLSGAFHPNALGHATIADAVLPTLRQTLGLSQP